MINNKWEIVEQVEELIILSRQDDEQLLFVNTDSEEMLFYSYGIWGINNNDIIDFLNELEIEQATIELYKQGKFYNKIEEYNSYVPF